MIMDDDKNVMVVGKPNIGNKMRRVREIRGVKQGALAKTIGVSQQTISDWEKSDSINKESLQKFANGLEVGTDEIINFEERAVLNFFNCTQTVTNGALGNNGVINNITPEFVKLFEEYIRDLVRRSK